MNKEYRFFLTLLALLGIGVGLSYCTWLTLNQHPALNVVFLIQSLHVLSYYVLLGLGVGIPLILLATIFGWLQVFLLISGNIDPHLGKSGFLNVLKTLCGIKT